MLRNKVSQTKYCSKVYKFSFCLLFYIPMYVCTCHVPCPIFRVKSKEMRGDSRLSQSCISYLHLFFVLLNRLLVGKRTTLRKRWHKLQILTGSDLATTFKPQNSQWGDNPKNLLVVLKCLQANIQTIWLELFIRQIVPISLLAFLLANSSSPVFVSTWK